LDSPRLEFVLAIGFGVVGAILLVLGLIFSTVGFSVATGLIIFGLLLIIAAIALGVEFGFIEGKGTIGSTQIFRSPQKWQSKSFKLVK
jgi:hypothetical protein